MTLQTLRLRQVQGSKLVDSVGTLEALADLISAPRKCLELTTLFSSHEQGWTNVSAFHSKCDGKGPTFVLIRSSDGRFYGGYTSVSWSNAQNTDSEAFLFRMSPERASNRPQRMRTEKFQVSASHVNYAQSSSTTNGPTFGGGHDLRTFTTNGIALSMNPHSYSTSGPLISSSVPRDTNNFQLEVLQVVNGTSSTADELEVPWLTGVSWQTEVD